MKIEKWNGHQIRFVEKDGEWWAVAKDACEALGLKQVSRAVSSIPEKYKSLCDITIDKVTSSKARKTQKVSILKERGIYRLAFKSRTKAAEDFQDWASDVISELRKKEQLEGFEIFRMFDKEHQKEAMAKIKGECNPQDSVPYIKSNTIANKAVSMRYGHEKMIKKQDMTPQMLIDRQAILDDTIELMKTQAKFNLDFSVSDQIYKKWAGA